MIIIDNSNSKCRILKALLPILVGICVGGMIHHLALAQPEVPPQVALGLWVDGTQAPVAVGDESPFLKGLGEAGSKVQRIIVTVFANGETIFPIKSDVFRQSLSYRTGKGPFAAFLRKAEEMEIEVYAAFELLQWVRPGSAWLGCFDLGTTPEASSEHGVEEPGAY